MAEDGSIRLAPTNPTTLGLESEPELASLLRRKQGLGFAAAPETADQDGPFDLRLIRPRAVDLKRLWQLTGREVPPTMAAALGPRVPILLNHVITPFPTDGKSPGGVWGLGYEFIPQDLDAATVAVAPSDELLQVASVNQELDLGLALGGSLGFAPGCFEESLMPGVSLTGAQIRASTNQAYQFAVKLAISFRKVIGAGFGSGGAKWQLFRQDERLDCPHALLQTLLVAEGTKEITCTVRTWAKKAGWLGTSLGARLWRYDDVNYTISLAGLDT